MYDRDLNTLVDKFSCVWIKGEIFTGSDKTPHVWTLLLQRWFLISQDLVVEVKCLVIVFDSQILIKKKIVL